MIREDFFWRWIFREKKEREEAEKKAQSTEWEESGGKWLVYADKEKIEKAEKEIEKFVEKGEIEAAKYWKLSKPSALCVYSLDKDREKTRKILLSMNLKPSVWEYDYARSKNIWRPRFWLSAFRKLRILISTFGIFGTIKFIFSAYLGH